MPSSWKTETSRYVPRLQALSVRVSETSSVLSSLGVTAPSSQDAGVRTILVTQLVLFNIGTLRIAHELTTAAALLFREGRITSTCLQLRFLFEIWGATAFSSALCDRVRDANLEDDATLAVSLKGIVTKIHRLIGGSRIPVKLPRGGETNTKSFNVIEFIRHLEKSEPGTKLEYEFLCEACHPSFIQQSYLWMAGSTGDNWTNDVFREHAHALLEQVISAGENATLGLAKVTKHVTEVSRPLIVASE